jgi:hypothetical protein
MLLRERVSGGSLIGSRQFDGIARLRIHWKIGRFA